MCFTYCTVNRQFGFARKIVLKINMSSSGTPKKSVSDKILYLCRCCNSENARHVPLYGKKSREEGLAEIIARFAELDICENDALSKYICRTCATKILALKKNVDEFRSVCQETQKKRENELAIARTKRGRKEGDQSPAASVNVSKRTRVYGESRSSRSLTGVYVSSNRSKASRIVI